MKDSSNSTLVTQLSPLHILVERTDLECALRRALRCTGKRGSVPNSPDIKALLRRCRGFAGRASGFMFPIQATGRSNSIRA